ncbi:30S ribosomal protein S20 [Parasphaerochaeta coccoides]|uniref:Small ribosomal subunit protein bS20 n=1 Tax=Parasphaerochaeta coccoides (strain ATCC BAA-1237 / DSM 17374 / SPN1) TaxID=760011 RepID=F4GLQ5_PARC1|nr:30S ribosomal protein S20 [Parasphaerochaeta coccoides]AEC02449.1 30S ribosomal protein S20 [Parasphaerochaeta coccoides DSM 17374]
MSTKSAEKRERQNEKRRMRNRAAKSAIRTSVKKFKAAIEAGDKATAETTMQRSFKLIDTAANKGILHRNTASRTKSRLHAHFNKMNAASAQ